MHQAWGPVSGLDCGRVFTSVCRVQRTHVVLATDDELTAVLTLLVDDMLLAGRSKATVEMLTEH